MPSIDAILAAPAPTSIADALAAWPERAGYHASPADWRDEVFYFLLVDRFSDEVNGRAPVPGDLGTPAGVAAIRATRPAGWDWKKWNESGATRFQGGTIGGV